MRSSAGLATLAAFDGIRVRNQSIGDSQPREGLSTWTVLPPIRAQHGRIRNSSTDAAVRVPETTDMEEGE